MKRRAHFIVSGRVQGVCYRMDACDEARALGLTGWVRNRPDGSVEVVAEGEDAALQSLLAWCRRGPPAAAVRDVAATYAEARGEFDGFRIAR
ncbi:MAG: acylphosphatase [Lentisphaerae bacterium]|nr:acylphosphatase [Lentisphaerota bacterium]